MQKKTDTNTNINHIEQRVDWKGRGLTSERPAKSPCNILNERRMDGGAGQGQQ